MKKLFLSFVAMMIAAVGFAQTSLLATLSHDGTISTYYGTSALKDALAAADNGDAITLSAGQFLAGDITKNITLRGAGMHANSNAESAHDATIVLGDFVVSQDDAEGQLSVEGVSFSNKMSYKGTVKNAMFIKTKIGSIAPSSGTLNNSTFIHCRISSDITLSTNSTAELINCVVFNPNNDGTSSSYFNFTNCLVDFTYYNRNSFWVYSSVCKNSNYKNCIILQKGDATWGTFRSAIPSSCTTSNCIGIAKSTDYNTLFCMTDPQNTQNYNCTIDVFKNNTTAIYDYVELEQYELTDEAIANYKDADGKQIGIHGGSLPYEEDPTTPRITKCNVASKSTADGKLSVDIEVKAAEY